MLIAQLHAASGCDLRRVGHPMRQGQGQTSKAPASRFVEENRTTANFPDVVAAQEVVAARHNDTYKEYAGAALARLMPANRSTWLRVYAPHWSRMKLAFNELDLQALQIVFTRHVLAQTGSGSNVLLFKG